MGAFIVAAFIFLLFVAGSVICALGEGMSDAPRYDNDPRNILIAGLVLAAVIASSHWLPDIGW